MEFDPLESHYLFDALDEDQRGLIRRSMRELTLEDGEMLFQMGQPATHFYFVRNGLITLKRYSPGGDEKIIEIIHPGGTFAEALMFLARPAYPVTAVAVGETRVVAFEDEALMQVLRQSVDTCFRIMGHMSARLHRFIHDLDSLTLQNATYRLVCFLLHDVPGSATGKAVVELSVPKHVLASRLSIKPETLSRILHNMTEQGLITVHGRAIQINDVAALRSQSGLYAN